MCKVVADNLAQNNTITVSISGSNLKVFHQICQTIFFKISSQYPTQVAAEGSEGFNHFLQTNKMLMLTAIESLMINIKQRVDFYQKKGKLEKPTPKTIKLSKTEMTAYYWFNYYYHNGFDAPTNAIFQPLLEFWDEQKQVVKQVVLEQELPIIEI